MLNGIETIFDNKERMLSHLKKKSYEKNTKLFIEQNEHYFREMEEYVEGAGDKEKAAAEIGQCLVQAVKEHFAGTRGTINARTQADLNFFMIYYVFPTILGLGDVHSKGIAEGIRTVWAKSFKESNIQYVDYDTLYQAFREKIFGIF